MHGFYFNISSRSTENFPAVAENQLEGSGSPFGSYRNDLTASRAPGTSAESTKAGGLARDKVRNAGWKVRCRLLSSCAERPFSNFSNETCPRSTAMKSPIVKTIPGPACCSKLQFRQRARHGRE